MINKAFKILPGFFGPPYGKVKEGVKSIMRKKDLGHYLGKHTGCVAK